MATYYVTILLVILFGLIADSYVYCYEDENNRIQYGINKQHLIPLICIFLIVGGFRFYVGSDFHAYYTGYSATWSEIVGKFKNFDEPMVFLVKYLSLRVWDNNQFFIFVENAIITLLVFRGIKRHSRDEYMIPLLLYIFYGGWLFSFGGIRQALAVSVVFAFIDQENSDSLLHIVLVTIVAFLFHKSALFMLPLIILARRKISYMQIILIFLLSFSIGLLSDRFYLFMGASIDQVGDYASNSINPIRVAIAFVPLLLIFLLLRSGEEAETDQCRFVFNMTIMNAALVLATQNSAYMNRMTYYTVIYSIVAIPKLRIALPEGMWKFYNIMTCFLFFVFFYVELGNMAFRWHFF